MGFYSSSGSKGFLVVIRLFRIQMIPLCFCPLSRFRLSRTSMVSRGKSRVMMTMVSYSRSIIRCRMTILMKRSIFLVNIGRLVDKNFIIIY